MSGAPDAKHTPWQPRRPRRASTYFLLAVFLASAAGGLYLWRGIGTRPVYAAAVDLPAFHQVGVSDVRLTQVRSSRLPAHATSDRNDLLGHYTLGAIRQDHPFDVDHLGPVVPAGALDGQLVTGLTASAAEVGGGTFARGDRIDILLSSTESAVSSQNSVLKQVLVLDVKPVGKQLGSFVLISALSRLDESKLLAAGGTARVFVLRVSPNTSR
jgi:Flp pilus assembly protein CpaB